MEAGTGDASAQNLHMSFPLHGPVSGQYVGKSAW